MSRKIRQPQKIFKVFCEGGTEHHYIDELRRQKKLSITLKLVNMEGGGYRNFLEQVRAFKILHPAKQKREDSTFSNCQ